MKQAHRFSGPGKPYEGLTKQTTAGPQWAGKVVTVESALIEPLSWQKPCRVFVNSMSDLFHEDVPNEFIDQVFAVMALAKKHTFQILTKRAERMREYCSRLPNRGCNQFVSLKGYGSTSVMWGHMDLQPWPLPNVWLGVSAEDQQRANERIPLLIQTPAAVRFVSIEPMLEKVLLDDGDFSWLSCTSKLTEDEYETMTPAQRRHIDEVAGSCCMSWNDGKGHFHGIDWVIVGGESGPGARPFDLAWARSIVQQCQTARVACFVKQLGAFPCDGADGEPTGNFRTNPETGRRQFEIAVNRLQIGDRKGGDPSEWPDDLRVREFPHMRAEVEV